MSDDSADAPASTKLRITTKKGDDGTTGLLYGGRVRKDSELPVAYGTVDEAQAAIGLARAEAGPGQLNSWLVAIERDLWVLMAELATEIENRAKLTPGQSAVTAGMVDALETLQDEIGDLFDPPTEFVVPGETKVAALLDVARTVVRRAERVSLAAAPPPSRVVPYLNRLSDLLWTMARWQEGASLTAHQAAHPKELS
jgi:cob(I)alamin adenosyltransferase